jgi:hypothetical protein
MKDWLAAGSLAASALAIAIILTLNGLHSQAIHHNSCAG